MKKLILFAVLMLALIMTAAACNTGDDNGEPPVSTDAVTEAPTEAVTEQTTDEETTGNEDLYVRPEYTDLSADGFKIDGQNASFSQRTSTGTGTIGRVLLDFDSGDNFTVSDFRLNDHDCTSCDKCGIVEKNGKKA
jgi:hypothetical protein